MVGQGEHHSTKSGSSGSSSSQLQQQQKQQSDRAIMICILVFFAAALTLAIVSNYSYPTYFKLDGSETRLWAFGRSSFTKSLHIIDFSQRVDKYFLLKAPELESTPGTTTPPQTHTETATLDGGDSLHFRYYLNRNSVILCTQNVTRGSVHMYVMKGKAEFESWATYIVNSPVPPKYAISSEPYTVAADDDYYVIFKNDNDYLSAALGVSVTVAATQYVLEPGATPVCAARQQVCDVQVSQFEPRKFILFVAPAANATTEPDATFEINAYNEPRWTGIAMFWVLVPSLIAVAYYYIIQAAVCWACGLCVNKAASMWLGWTAAGAGAGRVPLSAAPRINNNNSSVELMRQTGYLGVAAAAPYSDNAATAGGAEEAPGTTESTPLLSQSRPLPSVLLSKQ